MANKINIVVSAEDRASQTIQKVTGNLDKSATAATGFSTSLNRVRDIALGVYLPQLAAKIGQAGLGIATAAGDFEQGMNVFRAVSGATAAEMERVSARSVELGNDISLPGVSARTAADAMIELSRAGLSVNDTLDASKGVLSLAKAGQLETAQAAEIAANALLAFGLQGKEASRVADLLAAAANASSSDVAGIGLSLSQVSALAAQTKRPIEDVVTQIGLLANAGIKGSDAGTSLKSMLMQLISPTAEAEKAMKALNINVYDSQGRMKSTRDIIDQFATSTAGLTDANRDAALATIFGSDAVRSASILIRGGTKEYDAMTRAVTKQGAAQELAASYSKGLKGNIESITNTVETYALKLGIALLPALNAVSGAMSGNLGPSIEGLISGGSALGKTLWEVLGPSFTRFGDIITQNVWPTLTRLWREVIEPLIPVIGTLFVGALKLTIDALNVLVPIFTGFVNWAIENQSFLLPIIGALIGLKGALMLNAAFAAATAAFTLFSTSTVPAAVGALHGFRALLALPLVMPAIAVGAAIASIWSVVDAHNKAKNAIEGANQAIKQELDFSVKMIRDTRARYDRGEITKEEMSRRLKIYARATGGNYTEGGQTLVGENGPEIVNMPRGAQVIPAYRSRQMMQGGGSGGISINFYGSVTTKNDSDIERLAQRVMELIDQGGDRLTRGMAA